MSRNLIYILIVFAVFLAVFHISCENNNEMDLYGIQDCDTTDITWDSKVAAILQKNCVECHGPVSPYLGVRHDSYTAEMIVVNDGRLRGVINHLDGYAKMPKDRGKLPACELEILNRWLDNGAPEN